MPLSVGMKPSNRGPLLVKLIDSPNCVSTLTVIRQDPTIDHSTCFVRNSVCISVRVGGSEMNASFSWKKSTKCR